MESVLQELYDGEINPAENIRCKSPEYQSVSRKICAHRDRMERDFSVEAFKQVENLEDLYNESDSMLCFKNYCYGFKLGAALMLEIFAGGTKLTRESD